MGKKDTILNSALKLFNSSNIKAVTTNHIAKSISISPGNLYYHYKNKEEIIFDLFNIFINKHLNLCLNYREIDDIDHMVNFYDSYFSLVWDYRFLIRESYHLCSIDPRLQELFLEYRRVEVEEIIKTSKSFRDREIVPYISDEDIEKRAQLISILFSNLISYKKNPTREEWEKNCREYKELLFFMISRR